MKLLLPFILLISLASIAQAQVTTTKQPKIRMTSGFFTSRYELGDKDAKAKEIQLHLEKTAPEAYHQWRGAEHAERAGSLWLLMAAVGTLVGVVGSSESGVSLAGWTAAVAGWTGVVVCSINEGHRRKKAISAYNKQYGY